MYHKFWTMEYLYAWLDLPICWSWCCQYYVATPKRGCDVTGLRPHVWYQTAADSEISLIQYQFTEEPIPFSSFGDWTPQAIFRTSNCVGEVHELCCIVQHQFLNAPIVSELISWGPVRVICRNWIRTQCVTPWFTGCLQNSSWKWKTFLCKLLGRKWNWLVISTNW